MNVSAEQRDGTAASDQVTTTSYWLAVAAMAGLGVGCRLWYVRAVNPSIVPLTDAFSYLLLGQNLASGRGYVDPGALLTLGQKVPTAEFPPLFPAVIALLHLLGADSVEAMKSILAIAGLASILLVAEIARRVIGSWAGIVAAALAALSPSLIESDGSFMSEVVFVPLVAAALLAAFRSGGRIAGWLLPGALIGLASLARAEALLLVVLLAPGAVCVDGSRSRMRRMMVVALLATGAVLVVAPWTIRNYRAISDLVPISGSGNGAILGANCEETYREPLIGSWSFRCYERVDTTGASHKEAWSAYRKAGIDFMLAHRDRLPEVMVARLARTYGLRNPDRWGANPEGRDWDWAEWANRFGLFLVPAAILGSIVPRRPNRGHLLILWAPVALSCLITLSIYGNPRFRLVAEPSLLVLASAAITGMSSSAARIARRRFASSP